MLGLTELDGDTLALGETLGLTLDDGLTDEDGETEGETELLGLTDADGLTDGETDELGDTLELGETDGDTDDDGEPAVAYGMPDPELYRSITSLVVNVLFQIHTWLMTPSNSRLLFSSSRPIVKAALTFGIDDGSDPEPACSDPSIQKLPDEPEAS